MIDWSTIPNRDGVVLLGIPVGTDDFIEQFVNKTLQPKIQAMYRLPEFPTQIAYHMLRLVIVPSTNFLVRALGHIPEYFMEWDDRIKMTVFTLANQIHDYIYYEGAAKEQWDDDTIEKFIEGRDRQIRNKEITMHSRENYDLAIKLIHLSSRQGGLGIMMATKVAKDARLASIINCMAALNSRGLSLTISDRTAEFILRNEAHLSKTGIIDIRQSPNSGEFRQINIRETKDLQKRLSDLTQKILENEIMAALENEHRDLLPLFLDHQGDHANRVLIKPPSVTKAFAIPNAYMQEIITQTILLTNHLEIRLCHAPTGYTHNNLLANHMNSCSCTGGASERHTHVKRAIERVCKVVGYTVKTEKTLNRRRNAGEYRADIYVPTKNTVIDVTIVQTCQNRRTLEIAMERAYEAKLEYYNRMFGDEGYFVNTGMTIIPVVVGPRGQYYHRSWRDLLQFLGIQDPNATREEVMGGAPSLLNDTPPEKAHQALSLLRASSFQVPVDTAAAAKKWQRTQREYWKVSTVAIRRPRRSTGPSRVANSSTEPSEN